MTGIAPAPSDGATSGGAAAPDLGELLRRSARGDESAFAAVSALVVIADAAL